MEWVDLLVGKAQNYLCWRCCFWCSGDEEYGVRSIAYKMIQKEMVSTTLGFACEIAEILIISRSVVLG